MQTLALASLIFAAFNPNPTVDLHLGTYDLTWCGYKAAVTLETQPTNDLVFHGHIRFLDPQYSDVSDPFDVEQDDDDTLIMVRHLTGSQSGTYQRVFTQVELENDNHRIFFIGTSAEGPDCVGKRTIIYLN